MGGPPVVVIVAVKVTGCPNVDGFAGLTVMYQFMHVASAIILGLVTDHFTHCFIYERALSIGI